jgi:hypothetical protein
MTRRLQVRLKFDSWLERCVAVSWCLTSLVGCRAAPARIKSRERDRMPAPRPNYAIWFRREDAAGRWHKDSIRESGNEQSRSRQSPSQQFQMMICCANLMDAAKRRPIQEDREPAPLDDLCIDHQNGLPQRSMPAAYSLGSGAPRHFPCHRAMNHAITGRCATLAACLALLCVVIFRTFKCYKIADVIVQHKIA